jgi:competence protein ComEA
VRGMFLLLTVLLAGGVICLGRGMVREQAEGAAALMDRINPNTAPAGSLMRLEGIGPVRASGIIQYRQEQASEAGPVFVRPEDLGSVRGIGPKTVEKLAPYLELDETEEPKESDLDKL